MTTSAFGIIHDFAISKASTEQKIPSGYRPSHLQSINPRSKTYVKRGTGVQRLGGPMLGGAIGTGLGRVIGGPKYGALLGLSTGAIGGSLGFNRNIKSKDTIAINRRTNKQAKTKAQFPYLGVYNIY